MTKKKKYTPGWQVKKSQESEQVLRQQAARALADYYEAQELEKQLQETEQPVVTPNTNNNREESERTDTVRIDTTQLSPAQLRNVRLLTYTAESPESYLERTSDPTAFQDQIIPSILDPKFEEWANRRAKQAAKTGSNDFISKAARSAAGLTTSLKENAEDVVARMNKRIQQNNTFGKFNKDYRLTNDEIKEIDQYKMVTDPVYSNQRIKQIHKELELQDQQENAEINAVERPDNYTGASMYLPVGMGGSANLANRIASIISSAWAKSMFSDFIEETNSSQMKVAVGLIQRSKELVDLSDKTQRNIDLIEKYANNLVQLQRFNNTGFLTLPAQQRNLYAAILQENRDIKQQLENNGWWKDANNLASWAPSGILGRVAGFADAVIDDDIGGIRNHLYGLDSKLDDLNDLLNSSTRDQKWLNDVIKNTSAIKQQLTHFNARTAEKQDDWSKLALTDAQDIVDWRTGDNWAGTKVSVDPYYAAQKKLLERSDFDWSDPVKMAQFGWSGVAGGSNSSWWKSIISMTSKVGGAIGGAITTGGTSAAIQAGAIAASFEADKSAGSDENNIEAEDRSSMLLRNKLISNNKYGEFIEEGLEQLKRISTIPDEKIYTHVGEDGQVVKIGRKDTRYSNRVLKQILETTKDKEKLYAFVLDTFMSGLWHSKDPNITKMHADAVIGSNNQFYNDQPVNTADAAIGSIVDIATLAPVKYLARATKIGGKILARRAGLTTVGLHFNGFKEGVHNIANRIADSNIAKITKDGTIKVLDATSKVPLGVYVGSLAGLESGYYMSDGSVLGAAAGAATGAAAGYGLRKGITFIGKEGKIADAYNAVRAFGTRIPSAWMYAASAGKTAGNIIGRIGLDTASEMMQEGIQAQTSKAEYDYDVQNNISLATRVFNDMMMGANAAYIWMNQNDPEMKGEADVYSQMNATPLLTLFGPNTAIAGVRVYNGVHDMSLISAIANNIDATRRGNIAELEQAREYAKHISKADKEEMKNKFSQYRNIAGTHAEAKRKMNPGVEDLVLMEQDDHFIPTELIDEQEKDYEDIYALANSSHAQVIGERAGAKPGSDKYAKVVSMLNFRHKKQTEAFNALAQNDKEYATILGQPAIGELLRDDAAKKEREVGNFEEDHTFAESYSNAKTFEEKNNAAKLLVQAATLMDLIEDYSALKEIAAKDNVFLDHCKSGLKFIKQQLKKYGFDVETKEDVVNELNNSEEGLILQNLVSKINGGEKMTSMDDYLDQYSSVLRERLLLAFDYLMQSELYNDYLINPEVYIKNWENRIESDEKLESILEDDWVNKIRDYESAAAREVKDGDIYVGDDGYWYITKKMFNSDGEEVFEKHRYHPNSRVIDSEALPFDPVEYDKAKLTEADALSQRLAIKKANENIQSGKDTELKQEPDVQEKQELKEELEQEPSSDDEQLQEQSLFLVGDAVNVENKVGKIIGINDDNSVVVSFGAQQPIVTYPDQGLIQKVTSPIAESKYNQGDIIESNDGKKYTVAEVYLESIDPTTYTPSYSYNLLDIDSGNVVAGYTEDLIEKMLTPNESSSTVEPNNEQNEVISQLAEKLKQDKDATELSNGKKRRTPYDYLIRIKGTIQKYIRVHGILDSLFDEDYSEKIARERYINELTSLYNKSKLEFINRVKELLQEYNSKIAEKYGEGSAEYDYYAIDLFYYIRGNIINDPQIIPAIASILSSEQPGPAVVVGSIIDEISRLFFNGEIVENKPEYRMSDRTFNSIISQLKVLQLRFNDLGWVVDTNSYTWFGEFKNGVKMAGETDMIAIDRQGNIHILDFKTTSNITRFDSVLEYKTKDLEGNDVWIPIDPQNVPEGAETRVSSSFLDDIATKRGQVGKRTYAAQYAMQLEAYKMLIQQQLGRKVKSLEIIPFAVQYDTDNDVVKKITEVHSYDPVNLSKVPQLESYMSDVDNFLSNESASVTTEDVLNVIDDLSDLHSQLKQKLEENGISIDTKVNIHETLQQVSLLLQQLEDIKNNTIKLADNVFTDGLFSNRDSLVKNINYYLLKANEEIAKYNEDKLGKPKEKPKQEVSKNRSWLWEEPEIITEDDTKHWWQHNNLHSFFSEVKEGVKSIKGYIENTAKSDFIKNSTFVISRDDKNDLDVFSVVIEYRGLKIGPVRIRIGNDAEEKDMRNLDTVQDKYLSALGRNFFRQYYQLAKQLKPGERIIATGVKRTNGTIKYSGKNTNLSNTKFLPKGNAALLKLVNGVDSLVGVSTDGNVVEVDTSNREVIYSPRRDPDGNLVVKKIRERVVPGNDTEGIPDGVVVYLYKFKYDEDSETDELRTVPLVLQGRNLGGTDGNLILKILLDIANSKTPVRTENELYKVQVTEKDGTKRFTQIPGLTNKKVLKLITRFGGQAEYANDEFIFDYAKDAEGKFVAGHKKIRITDMRVDPIRKEDGTFHRNTIDLDLRKQEDVQALKEILALTQMHINQKGIMRASLNTTNEDSPFGALRTFFLDEKNQNVLSIRLHSGLLIDVDDVFADENDPTVGLTGIAWAIKHGYASTNANSIENPIISITELGIENKQKTERKNNKQKKDDEKQNAPEDAIEKPTVDATQNQQQPVVLQNEGEEVGEQKKKLLKKIMELMEDDDDDVMLPGGGRAVYPSLRKTPITEEEKKKIEKLIYRLVGNVAVKWSKGAIDVLRSGAQVAGRAAVNAIYLSDRLIDGTQFHEAFHRIFEILTPNKLRQKLYDTYRQKYGENLTDREISELFAEMFRMWILNKQEINFHWNILKTFREIKNYIDQLKELGDRKFAALFVLANSGIFRFVKPDTKNVEHFISVLGGQADMTLSVKDSDGNVNKINFDMIPSFGGRAIFDDAINGIIYALISGYSIDMLGSNAARIKTSRKDVTNLFRAKNDDTEHSSWFRVVTGEYTKQGEEFTLNDAIAYYRIYKQSDSVMLIAEQILTENPDIDKKSFKANIIQKIYEQESQRKPEDLDYNLKVMAQLFAEDTWWAVEQKINDRLRKISIDSERKTEDDYFDKKNTDDGDLDSDKEENAAAKTVNDHKDEFFDHARTDDATGPIRFFLSSIPDERFATQEDVNMGLVRSTEDKNGNPVTISNSINLLGFQQYLSMKLVSNKLLLACHNVSTVEELDEKLQESAKTDPVLYRIAKKYRNALNNEIRKTPSGKKNAITLNGKYVPEETYEQAKDEFGWYYIWNENGENPGLRIEGAVTQTNPDMESFVTQLFNYVACQKLDFIMVTLQQETDDDGNPKDNAYKAIVRSSDSDYAASVYPRSWFTRLRSGVTGIFTTRKNGTYTFTKSGKQIFYDSINTLKLIQTAFTSKDNIKINGVIYNKDNENDFRSIENLFIKALNNLGIDISREALEYYLQEDYGIGVPIRRAFGLMITRADKETSFKKFIEELDGFKSRITENGNNEALTLDSDEEVIGYGRNAKKIKRSGSFIYSANGFVNWLSRAASRYSKATSEIVTNGPEGTKRYAFAQSNTASDMTDDFNKAVVIDGEIKGSRMLKDLSKYIYNSMKGLRGIPKGSIIVKHLFTNKKINLKLHVHGGVKVDTDFNGGLAYKKITEREDWLSKAAILRDGGIIFPTLSDKSTWFYLTGVPVPGINYSSISSMSASNMLRIGLHNRQKASSTDAHVLFDFTIPNTQLDQMIEYAECERASIEREINRSKKGTIWEKLKALPRIEFFDDNRMRFGGLSEIVYINENGNTELALLNDYDLTPELALQRADELFFNKTSAEKRLIMALTLELGFMENIAMLEHAGLIVASGTSEERVLDDNGNDTGKTRLQNRLLRYKNVGLDSEVINELKKQYIAQIKNNTGKNLSLEQSDRAESLAICAYVWDIYLRGLISNEETERMYTGQPQFFKWVHGKIKDALSGKTINALTDRYSDQSKRLGGFGSTGDKNRLDLANMRRKYVCTEVEDWIVKSEMYDNIKQSFIDNYIRDAYVSYKQELILEDSSLSEDQKTEQLDLLNDSVYGESKISLKDIEKYFEENKMSVVYNTAVASAESDALAFENDINVADGAAYITPKMAKDLLRQRGRFDSKVKLAFNILEGKAFVDGKHVNPLSNKEAFKIISDAFLGAQKYSAYGYRIDDSTGDIPVHYYNKFALFPLFPQIATGFTSDILRKMEEQDGGIDMLMMHSAVKTGSQEPSICTPGMFKDEQQFKDFRFKTYTQDFAFIRRQLNTDPRERKTISMGTQMTKVALANLDRWRPYKREDGTIIRGRDLLDSIMTSINMLSDFGKQKIEREFFTDGELDLQKFSAFLEQELERRDADSNLLDGIEVVEEDGVLRFKVPLEAMSSVDWILSIIVSKINREVCDINVKGNAFYQRSVWGMEGKPTILSDENVNFKLNEINGGNNLKMINEDGSMDAVISIDFFYDIIPESIRGNFNKSKEWLIKHKIIGPDAKANTIASRIPTQAQSSIHALRFVDVLPVIRDTIILPREFTKITGSDFDIDKLFLVRLSYKVSTKRNKDTNTVEDTVTSEFSREQDEVDYYRNLLINDYLTLLKSHGKEDKNGIFENGDSIHISMRSIDKDTDLVKNVLKRIERNRPVSRNYAYKFGNIAFQVATKAAFMVGKFGIGPFALNNNSQILTQLYGVKFSKNAEYKNILDSLGCLDLSKKRDKNRISILSWLSGLINAHVDVAKDPYIMRLNINTFTYNLTNLLIRTGMGERTLLFTPQPIMVELARVYEDAGGQFMTDISKSKTARQESAVLDFVIDAYKRGGSSNGDVKFIKEMIMGRKNSNEENRTTEEVIGSYAQALFGIDNKGKYTNEYEYIDPSTGDITLKKGCILEDILTNEEALININKGFTFDNMQGNRPLYRVHVKDRNGNNIDVDMSPRDVQLYVFFIQNALKKYGLALSDLVNACKIDTKKQGKNYVEQQAYLDKYNQVFDNESGIFEDEGLTDLKEKSYIDTKTKNATFLYENILSQFSIQSTSTFKDAHDTILKKLNSSVQNKKLSEKVSAAIMSYIKSKFFTDYIDQRGEDYFKNLMYGKNSLQNRLLKILAAIRNDKTGKFSKFGEHGNITLGENGTITNPLLKALQPDVYEEKKGFLHPLFLKLENALLDDSENANAIERAWDELYRDTYHYVDDEDGTRHYYIKEFAEDLAVYAFITSGDRVGNTKFFRFVPNPIRTGISIDTGGGIMMSYADYMLNTLKLFLDGTFEFTEDDIDSIIGQNWYDNDFVKEVRMTITRKGKRIAVNTSLGTISTKSAQVTSYKKRNGKVGFRTDTLVKTINYLIAGVKNAKNEPKETIHRCNDENYPSFIKVRRPSSTKYDADNYLLYKLKETRPIDQEDETKGTFPVYQLYNPEVSNIRAGSYQYVLYNYDEISPSYPTEVQNVIDSLENNILTTEENTDRALKLLVDVLNEMGVILEDSELDSLIRDEFEARDFEFTDNLIDQAVKWVRSRLKKPETKKNNKIVRVVEKTDTEEKSSKSEEIEENDTSVATDDLFSEDEISLSDETQETEEGTLAETQDDFESLDDEISEDDFDVDAINTCKMK